MKAHRYPLFDWLRLTLALLVVLNHTHVIHQTIPTVAAFVCLSGFLIPTSFDNSRSWGHFAWKRILRVGPAFMLSLCLVALLFGIAAIGPTLLGYVTMLYLGDGLSRNLPMWSLALEELLYGVHGALRISKGWSTGGAWICFGAALAAWLGLESLHVPWQFRPWWFYFVPICAFFAGNLLNRYRKNLAAITPMAAGLGLAVTLVLVSVIPEASVTHGLVGIAFCVTAVVAAYRLPQPRLNIPDVSYGVYVYHYPVIEWLRQNTRLSPAEVLMLTLATVFPLALCSWFLVEKPILRLKNWQIHRDPPDALAAGAIVSVNDP